MALHQAASSLKPSPNATANVCQTHSLAAVNIGKECMPPPSKAYTQRIKYKKESQWAASKAHKEQWGSGWRTRSSEEDGDLMRAAGAIRRAHEAIEDEYQVYASTSTRLVPYDKRHVDTSDAHMLANDDNTRALERWYLCS